MLAKAKGLFNASILVIFVVSILFTATTVYAYLDQGREYRVASSNLSCLSGGIIGIRLIPKNPKSTSAAIEVQVEKCQGGNFISDGYYYVTMDGKRITNKTRFLGIGKSRFTTTIYPPHNATSAYGNHTYQLELYSDNDPTTAKWSGKATAATWGKCWCNEYVRQRFSFSQNGNGGTFGAILLNNGYRLVNTSIDPITKLPKETPKIGDVAVMQYGFPTVPTEGHVGLVTQFNSTTWKFSLKQGGSSNDTGSWLSESFCYNVRNVAWGTSAKGRTDIKFYRR